MTSTLPGELENSNCFLIFSPLRFVDRCRTVKSNIFKYFFFSVHLVRMSPEVIFLNNFFQRSVGSDVPDPDSIIFIVIDPEPSLLHKNILLA